MDIPNNTVYYFLPLGFHAFSPMYKSWEMWMSMHKLKALAFRRARATRQQQRSFLQNKSTAVEAVRRTDMTEQGKLELKTNLNRDERRSMYYYMNMCLSLTLIHPSPVTARHVNSAYNDNESSLWTHIPSDEKEYEKPNTLSLVKINVDKYEYCVYKYSLYTRVTWCWWCTDMS